MKIDVNGAPREVDAPADMPLLWVVRDLPVDCGTAVNPLAIEAQVQGSVAFGLTTARYGKLTLVGGKVQQSNFHDYPMLRMAQMPTVDVHIISSGAKMGGIGEPATAPIAPIAPAVANSVFALTKRRLRSLPLVLALVALAACGDRTPGPSTPARPAAPTTEAGLASWETVRAVLQHPRCQNCHPADDIPLQGDEGRPHGQGVQRGDDGFGMAAMRCTTCHGPANPPASYGEHTPPGVSTGWHMPPSDMPMVFVGRSSHDLCEQLLDPARNGHKDLAALRIHLDDPLVLWGWDPGFGRAPVSIPHADFVAAFETWTAASTPCP